MRIKKLPEALVIAALLVTLAISLGVATPNVYGGDEDSPPTLPEKPELKYPNLGSNLDQLVASVEKGETSVKEAAEDAPIHQETSIAVTIHLSGERGRRGEIPGEQRQLRQQCGRGLHRGLRARITARAGLGTARRHPCAGNHPGRSRLRASV